MNENTRYFQIGFKRCGTTALSCFFERNGIPAVHFDNGKLGRRMQRNQAEGIPLLSGYERYDAFTNMEYVDRKNWFDGFRCWRELMETYGNSRFILNTRNKDNWLRSMAALGQGRRSLKQDYYRARYCTNDPARLAEIWSRDWDDHHREVLAGIPAERLLVFDIEADPAEQLCEFSGLPASGARYWTVENPTLNPLGAAVAHCLPVSLKRAVPSRIRLSIKRRLRRQ